MSFSPSQCETSGSESGWTMYLDQSQSYSYYPCGSGCHRDRGLKKTEEEEAEDLSMVSDASSGPPHFHEEEEEEEECIGRGNGCFCSACSASKLVTKKVEKKKKIGEHRGEHKQHSYLEDTASSPAMSFSKVIC